MSTSQLNPPADDELEVSVFGPGYGESIVIHLGGGKWMLVDSCLDPNTGFPAPTKYLADFKVDLASAVKMVVATHWHDDHIRGLSAVFRACDSAQLVISKALATNEFLSLATLYSQRPFAETTGVDEFVRVLRMLGERKKRGAQLSPPTYAVTDRVLHIDSLQLASLTVDIKVSALSPSDASILKADLAFAQLMPRENLPKRRLVSPTPNHASVVLWVEVGQHKILLGADLENTADPMTGWSVILDEAKVISGKASVFKIPHHGSENAHENRVWPEILHPNPWAVVTPYRGGKKPLPSPTDVERIASLTNHAYATASARQQKIRWGERVVRELVKEVAREIHGVYAGWGHVRFRQKITDPAPNWQVELFGDAYPLSGAPKLPSPDTIPHRA